MSLFATISQRYPSLSLSLQKSQIWEKCVPFTGGPLWSVCDTDNPWVQTKPLKWLNCPSRGTASIRFLSFFVQKKKKGFCLWKKKVGTNKFKIKQLSLSYYLISFYIYIKKRRYYHTGVHINRGIYVNYNYGQIILSSQSQARVKAVLHCHFHGI